MCEEFRIDKQGLIGAKRPEGEKPPCERCPKLKYEDALTDERVMQAVMLSQLGVDEKDIKDDPWMYLAVRIAKAHYEAMLTRDAETRVDGMARERDRRPR